MTRKLVNVKPTKFSLGKCKNTWPTRHRIFSKLRHKKPKRQNTYGNQHRLDHTYAASANFISIPQTNTVDNSDDCIIIEDEIITHNWLHNNTRLEMHENGIKLSIQDSACSGDVSNDKSACLQVTGATNVRNFYKSHKAISNTKIDTELKTNLSIREYILGCLEAVLEKSENYQGQNQTFSDLTRQTQNRKKYSGR